MTELVSEEQDRQKRDERRALLMGVAWLVQWNEEGRGRSRGAGSYIRETIAPREAPLYEWIWVAPYLTRNTGGDVDTYRGQQAGRALMARFAEAPHLVAAYWFDAAKRVAETTEEEWLFLTRTMTKDGWVQREVADNNGKTFTVWTKATE